MKRILSVILMLSVLIGIFSFSAYAKSTSDVVNGVIREQVIIDDMCMLCEAVDGGDAANIFGTVLVVYPDLVAMIKRNMNDEYTDSTSSGSIAAGTDNERYAYAVTNLIQNTVFLDDLAKLTEVISTGDSGNIFGCVLEIYPDFVIALKNALAEYPGNDTVALTLGSRMPEEADENTALWVICAGIGGIAVGAVSVYIIMKKKKETVTDPQG